MSLLPDILKPLPLNSHVLPRTYYSSCLQGFCLFIKGRFMALEHIGVHQEWDFTVSLRDGATPNIPTDASPAASSRPEADQQNFQGPCNAPAAHSWGLLPTLRKGSNPASLLTYLLCRKGARRGFSIPFPSVKRSGEWSWTKRPLQRDGDGRRLALPVTSAASRRQKMSPDLGSWLTQSPQPLALTHTRTYTRTHTAAHARSRWRSLAGARRLSPISVRAAAAAQRRGGSGARPARSRGWRHCPEVGASSQPWHPNFAEPALAAPAGGFAGVS